MNKIEDKWNCNDFILRGIAGSSGILWHDLIVFQKQYTLIEIVFAFNCKFNRTIGSFDSLSVFRLEIRVNWLLQILLDQRKNVNRNDDI